MKILSVSFIFLFASATIFSQGPSCQERMEHASVLKTQFRSGNESLRSDTVDVLDYSVYLDFTNADLGTLSGNCQVKFSPLMNINSLSLDLLSLTVDSVTMHGNPLLYNYNDTLLLVEFSSTINSGTTDSLVVYYHGAPQMDPSGWGGFYMTGGYYYNLGVGFESDPHNFGRVWHPCFDNFVERATYRFEILTDGGNTAYCNGTRENVVSVGADSLLTTWVMHTEIPSYLASVAVSSYTHVAQNYYSVLQNQNFPIWLAAKPADTTNLKNSFIHLQDALAAFENYYGPYQWERVGYVLVPFNSGAMEHATNIAYPLLTANGTTTYETLFAHELSHHWWGDWVTCKTAEEMWINEGMARYAEHLFTEALYGYEQYMSAMRTNHYDVLHMAHINDSGYYALNAVPVKYTYGDHSYNKGADVLHTMRSYMGDANFFAGLHAIQNDFGGGNISSVEFMEHLNTLSGVNVTDFFNAWIFQPGFAHFSVINFTVSPNGGNYDVTVLVDQKLKGGADYHANVPLQLTFMDADWNTHTEEILMSGDYQQFQFTIPVNPVFAGINLNERINDATTAVSLPVTSTGTYQMNYAANFRLVVSSLTDSAFVRVEHNWVYPDVVGVPDNIQISMQRYWNIHGVDLETIAGTMRFEFNGKNTSGGFYDHELMVDLGDQPFTEDSLVLLYRPNTSSDWQIHTNYTMNYTGSHTDKYGYAVANIFMPGQYTFGYRTHSVGLPDQHPDKIFSVYPNPVSDTVFIDLNHWKNETFMAEVIGMEGRVAFRKTIQGGQKNALDVSSLGEGVYLILLYDSTGQTAGSKRIVVE